ncbi:peptidoglycan DD-metalloendopeptidase family protein [Kordiimonas lipolytica]|uniref:Peptidoglycan DD-metalloendopeptidase family protein n=1 Tax=Kordiimonas lipolytica TaxID=1662421 RepID=A0ABV8U631_9PROT|nr:peptidoglycan DD-metalloendopeptidase family protein [Kordiimonas lipolytica]
MFRLNEIRDKISDPVRRAQMKSRLAQALKLTESPSGFAAMAGTGLVLVLILNLANDDPLASDNLAEQIAVSQPNEAAGALQAKEPTNEGAALEMAPEAEPAATSAQSYRLKRNETLIGLLLRAGVSSVEAHKAVSVLKDVTNLRRLQRGQVVRIIPATDNQGSIRELRMRDSFEEEAVLVSAEGSYQATRSTITTLPLTHLVEGEITDSLYMSAQRVGLPTPVIVELIRLMSFDVDFEREIRTGDRFQVYFERTYAPDFGDLADGRILHMRLELQKRTLEATYFEDENGRGDYFDTNGHSTRKALMKTPLDVTVVTSSYGKRKHPVLGYTRQHTGVDFRARTGTPIMAAGDGVVERASRYGGYGNYIRIRHNSTYETAYAHLSKYGRGIKAGVRVKQGQIIGYAGATGRVTAAHLHYEVLVNGRHANPLTLKLPTGRKLDSTQLAAFQKVQATLASDIDKILMQQQILQTASVDAADVPASVSAEVERAITADR